MKKMLFRLSAILFVMVCAVAGVFAQQDTIVVPPPLGPGATLPDFLNLYTALESAVVLVAGYLHNFIPGLNLIRSKWIRILIIGAVTITIFTALGLNSGIGTALVFLQTVGIYELLFKKIKPSAPVTPVLPQNPLRPKS